MTTYKTIPDLPPADAANDTDQLEVTQAGTSRSVTVDQLGERIAVSNWIQDQIDAAIGAIPSSVAIRAPTPADDSTKGYAVGNLWNSSAGLFVAQSVAATKAAWTLSSIGNVLPGDAVPGALVLYGMRKMRMAYAGSAIQVIRASDSAVLDIGFVGNELNEAALDGFLSGTTGKVTKFYDQSGNANDAVQATSANQPLINTVNTLNGTRTVVFNSGPDGTGADIFMPFTFASTSARTMSAFLVMRMADCFVNSGILRLGATTANSINPRISVRGTLATSRLAASGFGAEAEIMQPLSSPAVVGFVWSTAANALISNNNFSLLTAQAAQNVSITTGQLAFDDTNVFYGRYGLAGYAQYGSTLSAANQQRLKEALTKQYAIIPQCNDFVLVDGDSIAYGSGAFDTRGYHRQAYDNGMLARPVLENVPARVGGKITDIAVPPNTIPGTDYLNQHIGQHYRASYDNFIVTLRIGVNDVSASHTAAEIYAAITTYVAYAKALGPNVRVVVGTNLPSGAVGFDPTEQATLSALNNLIRTNAAGADAIADYAADPIMGPQAATADTTLYNDGLHPTTYGYSLMAPIYAAAVNRVFR